MGVNEKDMARWHRESVVKELEAAKAAEMKFLAEQDAAGERLREANKAYDNAVKEWAAALESSAGASLRKRLAYAEVKKLSDQAGG